MVISQLRGSDQAFMLKTPQLRLITQTMEGEKQKKKAWYLLGLSDVSPPASLLLSSPSLSLCLSPVWVDCVHSSGGSSGSLRPSACERACGPCSEPLPGSGHKAYIHKYAHTWANQAEEKSVSGVTDTIILVEDSIKSANCNLSICHITVVSHASMALEKMMQQGIWLGGRVTSPSLSSSSQPCTNEHEFDPWPASELIGSSLYRFILTQNGPCAFCSATKMTPVPFSVGENTFVAVWQQMHADLKSPNGFGRLQRKQNVL